MTGKIMSLITISMIRTSINLLGRSQARNSVSINKSIGISHHPLLSSFLNNSSLLLLLASFKKAMIIGASRFVITGSGNVQFSTNLGDVYYVIITTTIELSNR